MPLITMKRKKTESRDFGRINMWCLDVGKKEELKKILRLVM